MAIHPGRCRTWSETPKTGFLMTQLLCLGGSMTKPRKEPVYLAVALTGQKSLIMFQDYKTFFMLNSVEHKI